MALPERSTDALLAVKCIVHVLSREAFCAEAARLLRTGRHRARGEVVPSQLGLLRQRVLAFALER